jgi:hypothetical protein
MKATSLVVMIQALSVDEDAECTVTTSCLQVGRYRVLFPVESRAQPITPYMLEKFDTIGDTKKFGLTGNGQ